MKCEWLDTLLRLTDEAAGWSNHYYRFSTGPDGPRGVGWLEIEGVRDSKRRPKIYGRRAQISLSRAEQFTWQVDFTVFSKIPGNDKFRDDGMYILELDDTQYDLIREGRIALPEAIANLEKMTEAEEIGFAKLIIRD